VAGARYDAHNLFGGQFSPRLHLKYNLRPLTTIRTTLGRGFRSANAFGDQLGLLASSRIVRVIDTPQAEESWNTGISFLHKFKLFNRDAVINTDYYFTYFENQLVVDRDFSARQLLFYNLDGESYAHSWQADFQMEPLRGLGLKFSYKYQFVQTDYIEGSLDKPLIPRHRALFNAGYTSPDGKWYLDFTANYYGVSRLPGTEMNPEELQLNEKSDPFFLLNSQITRTIGNFEVYAGSDNLGNFIQDNAIVDAENPFGQFFDASMIYGPLNGRTIYLGVRFNFEKKPQP
jgi:outer membrane receptor protein involved in Fe transport